MIEKTGSPHKIAEIASNNKDFDIMWDKIEKKNDLCKCSHCKHLLSKKIEGAATLKHRGLKTIIKSGEIEIICPSCNTLNCIKIG
jgi:phage FluMu protein Com